VVVGRLSGIRTVLLDLDGTLYVGSRVVAGASEAVRWLRAQGLTVRFTTNTDSIPPATLADRLARLGFPAAEDELVTPIAVAGRLFASTDEARVLAVAADGVCQLLAGVLAGPGQPVTHVLVADPSDGATYDDLDAAFRALRAGAELVATQVNRIAVRDDGEHLDTGGWVRLLEYATGQTARVLGKPSPEFFTAPLDALGRGPDTALVVGDDPAADIGGGHAVGAATVLVRTGKGDRPQPGAGAEPDAVVDSVADLPGLLRG
jgi:HAD superfamily hydrolase (TIGR01458 family)